MFKRNNDIILKLNGDRGLLYINKNVYKINKNVYNIIEVNKMKEFFKLLCLKTGTTQNEIAIRLNKSPQAFSQKINRETFSLKDLEDVAIVTDCKLECYFELPNGEKIKIII